MRQGEKVRPWEWGRGKREVRRVRRWCEGVTRRHEGRCEALHYGLGAVGDDGVGGGGFRRVVRLGVDEGKGEEGLVGEIVAE